MARRVQRRGSRSELQGAHESDRVREPSSDLRESRQAVAAPAHRTLRTALCSSVRDRRNAEVACARCSNVLKRVYVQAGGANLGLPMRTLVGAGTPRDLQGRAAATFKALAGPHATLRERLSESFRRNSVHLPSDRPALHLTFDFAFPGTALYQF